MKDISFQDKELKILREAVDEATSILGQKMAQSADILSIIQILEEFIRTNKCLCYGGTAINNILPEQDRFYNRNIEIPDYDFFTPFAVDYAKKLADIYYNAGYEEVEAKAGVHSGTYKVYVNFVPIADITYLTKEIYDNLIKKSLKVNGISYCPPDFLRMSMYLELSRPMGDVSRWEKVLKRLILLNKNYPLKGNNCKNNNFFREYEGPKYNVMNIYRIVRKSIINQGLIFFGGYAASLYGKYMPKRERKQLSNIPDFDILSEDAKTSAQIIKEQLLHEGFKNIVINKKSGVGDLITEHYEIMIKHNNKIDVLCYIYNTMLSFYLIFIYVNRPYYDVNRLLCMSEYLFKVQLKNRLEQKGLLKRFSINCYGKHHTLEDNRSEKAQLYKDFRQKKLKKGSPEYDKHFLRYIPAEVSKTRQVNRKHRKKTKKYKN
jgi:hypothetical protein